MSKKDVPIAERLKETANIDFTSGTKGSLNSVSKDFENYIIYRQVVAEDVKFDFGLSHWNKAIFNTVPAQVVGAEVKKALMFKSNYDVYSVAKERYGHYLKTGSVKTGFTCFHSLFKR